MFIVQVNRYRVRWKAETFCFAVASKSFALIVGFVELDIGESNTKARGNTSLAYLVKLLGFLSSSSSHRIISSRSRLISFDKATIRKRRMNNEVLNVSQV